MLISTPLFAQSPPGSPAPLNSEEKRRILAQLYELQTLRGQVVSYEEFINREKTQDQRERDNWQRALDLEREAVDLAHKERDLAAEKAAFYEQAYKSLTKRPGLGCRILAAVTFGVHRCN